LTKFPEPGNLAVRKKYDNASKEIFVRKTYITAVGLTLAIVAGCSSEPETIETREAEEAVEVVEFKEVITPKEEEEPEETSSEEVSVEEGVASSTEEVESAEEVTAAQIEAEVLEFLKTQQARLKELGYYKDAIDGIIGPASRDAIRSFQKQANLTETGKLDSVTVKALAKEDAPKAPPAPQPESAPPAPQPESAPPAPQAPSEGSSSGGSSKPTPPISMPGYSIKGEGPEYLNGKEYAYEWFFEGVPFTEKLCEEVAERAVSAGWTISNASCSSNILNVRATKGSSVLRVEGVKNAIGPTMTLFY